MKNETASLYSLDSVVETMWNESPFLRLGIITPFCAKLTFKVSDIMFKDVFCIIKDKKTIIFQGWIIAETLGYDDVQDALDNVVSNKNKTEETLQEDEEAGIETIKDTFINKMGLLQLILNSNNEKAVYFRKALEQLIPIGVLIADKHKDD